MLVRPALLIAGAAVVVAVYKHRVAIVDGACQLVGQWARMRMRGVA